MQLPTAKNQVLRHQHYHLQCINVCVKMKLVILLGEKTNLPNPIPYEDSIASLRVYWKIVLVPGGLLAALKQQQKKKNLKDAGISHRCCCCMGKLLSAAKKGTVEIQDRRAEHMQITDWMRLLLSPTALQSDQEDEGKSWKSAPFWKQSKIPWGKKKRGKEEEQVFPFSCCHY